MRLSKLDASTVRRTLAGMITSSKVCSQIATAIDSGERFDSDWANTVAKWCCEHLRRYNSPPNSSIKLIYQKWTRSQNFDPTITTQIEDLLEYISDEYSAETNGNDDYLLDEAKEYFDIRKAKNAIREAEDFIDAGDAEGAFRVFEAALRRVDFNNTAVSNPQVDHQRWMSHFNEERTVPLFVYPGDLGRLIGNSFDRGTLYAFMGVEKAGKSFYLLDAAFRTLKNRHTVAFFEVGDLGEKETYERLGQRILHSSVEEGSVYWPTGWSKKDPDIPIRTKRHCDGVSVGSVMRKLAKYTRNRDLFRLSCHPNSSITVAQIAAQLTDWRRNGWTADLVVIDYADILAPPRGYIDSKDQIDETWKQLRRLSQELNCCVITGTQTGAQAYRKKGTVITRGDFSGRKTKLAHVNGMIGLNATAVDKKYDITRINWVVRRKGGGSELTQVLVAGCFAAGMPIVLSKFASYAKQQLTADDSEEQDSSDNSEWED